MDNKEILEHYTEVINNLIDTNSYWKVYFQSPFSLEDNLYGHIEDDIPNNIDICGGATRICVIDHNCDWVVKFDYCEDRHGSVCQREQDIYEAAENEDLQEYFSEMKYIGDFVRTINFYTFFDVERKADWYGYDVEAIDQGISYIDPERKRDITIRIPLYACRRADKPNFEYATTEDKERIRSARSPLAEKNFAVAETFVSLYGFDEFEKLSAFIVRNGINDLHCNNVGMVDGIFCLIDYGGYFDPDGESEYYDDSFSSSSEPSSVWG